MLPNHNSMAGLYWGLKLSSKAMHRFLAKHFPSLTLFDPPLTSLGSKPEEGDMTQAKIGGKHLGCTSSDSRWSSHSLEGRCDWSGQAVGRWGPKSQYVVMVVQVVVDRMRKRWRGKGCPPGAPRADGPAIALQ
jgi:hypothetical protein